MKTREILAVGVLATIVACGPPSQPEVSRPDPAPSPKPGETPPEGQPPAIPPSAGAQDDQSLVSMRSWLEAFAAHQQIYYKGKLRFAKDVTVDGKITPLLSPFETQYRIDPEGQHYTVTIRHPPSNQRCFVEDGELVAGSPVSDAGKVICSRIGRK